MAQEFVRDMYREERTSAKTGKQYQVLVIKFENGYELDVFLSNEQKFILSDVPLIN